MEGLWLARELRPLQARLPAERLNWRFPDPHTFVLPLVPAGALWIDLNLPDPRVEWRPGQAGVPDGGPSGRSGGGSPARQNGTATAFQSLLAARAGGALLAAEQQGLDRVVHLGFAADDGFVPRPPVTLVLELTGRHANAMLLDEAGTILGVHREVGGDRNRFRQLRAGLAYRPPPPYDKLDPRRAGQDDLAEALSGRPLIQAHRRIDGLGPSGGVAWAALAGLDAGEPLSEAQLPLALAVLPELIERPPAAQGSRDLISQRRSEAILLRRERLRKAIEDRAKLVALRMREAEQAARAEEDAERLRDEANLLLALGANTPKGASRVTLTGFDGQARELDLDPRLSVVANAERRFDQARRRAARAERARGLRTEVVAEAEELQQQLAGLPEASDVSLKVLEQRFLQPPRSTRTAARAPGLRVTGPHGFEVVIGRNARENDLVTFRVARSMDTWLHAQGVHGAHVVVRSGGRELPFDTLVFAAELAAGHAEVGAEEKALVDYTLRKHVWKVKGMPPGAVHYTQQKTLAVAPRRLSEVREQADA